MKTRFKRSDFTDIGDIIHLTDYSSGQEMSGGIAYKVLASTQKNAGIPLLPDDVLTNESYWQGGESNGIFEKFIDMAYEGGRRSDFKLAIEKAMEWAFYKVGCENCHSFEDYKKITKTDVDSYIEFETDSFTITTDPTKNEIKFRLSNNTLIPIIT